MDAKDARVYGWGPDYSEVDVFCSVEGCSWDKVLDSGEAIVTIGDLLDAVQAHISEAHKPVRHLHMDGSGACIPSEVEPVGKVADHCNESTGWELVSHVYQPDACAECARIATLYVDCPKESK